MNGQDPEAHPEKFTPKVVCVFKWPTDEEAHKWAKNAIKSARKENIFKVNKKQKMVASPPEGITHGIALGTDENQPSTKEPWKGPAVPFGKL